MDIRKGQRIGIVAVSSVGKVTQMGMMAGSDNLDLVLLTRKKEKQ